ncbi:MAG: lipocalin family protein [Bacteroidetes bacterium]|nr:lipocalin family protein [Bacteroidota bacterium]
MKTNIRAGNFFMLIISIITSLFLFSFNQSKENKLIGKWKLESFTSSVNGKESKSSAFDNREFEFYIDNKYLLTQPEKNGLDSTESVTKFNGDYKIANNSITFYFHNIKETTYELVFLTDSKIKLIRYSSISKSERSEEVYNKVLK